MRRRVWIFTGALLLQIAGCSTPLVSQADAGGDATATCESRDHDCTNRSCCPPYQCVASGTTKICAESAPLRDAGSRDTATGGAGTGGTGAAAGGTTGTGTGGGATGGAAVSSGGRGGFGIVDVPSSCLGAANGPIDSSDAPRRTIPWTLVPAARGGGGGTSGGPCAASGGVNCAATARVHLTPSGPELELASRDVWRWDTTGVAHAVSPPAVAEGASVWVTSSRESPAVCPFCQGYVNNSLEIRDREGGQILWFAQEGPVLADVTPQLQDELFGVHASTSLACEVNARSLCYGVDRRVFDHLLPTTPAQTVRHATLAMVNMPRGTYQVFWAYSEDRGVQQCFDGPVLAHDTGFAASRMPP